MPLGEYLAVLRRRGWIIPLVVIAATVSAYGVARLQSPVYRSTIRLEVTGRFDYGAQLTAERQLSPLAQRILTTEVASEVDRRLRLDLGAPALLARVHVAPIVENMQIEVDADDVDPARAEAIAREFARVYEEQHAARELGQPVAERTVISTLDQPTPAVLVWPQARSLVAGACGLGLLLGVLLVFALDYLDDTLTTAADVERHLGLACIALIPRAPARPAGLAESPLQAPLAAARRSQ